MISVIICSVSVSLLENIRSSITKTIGVPFEILAYDNAIAQRGICEIYNQGVMDANYEILCFVHEDVEFNSIGWGKEVVQAFGENRRLGLLGIAGSSYKSLSPSGWQATHIPAKINFIHLTQHYKYSEKAEEIKYSNESSEDLAKVAVIDGVWFCGKKNILTKYSFDSLLLQKFHGYDIDISLSVGAHFDVCVTFKVLLTHFSEGNFGKDWISSVLLLHEKWRHTLPLNKSNLTEIEMKFCELKAFKSFVNTMRKAGCSAISCMKVLNRSGLRNRFGTLLYFRLALKCFSA
ncbi:glycosyltransferase [Daejeonella sp.]|uniref:glycosyltransferase n=1 Tax=Daejeonella sp. TaxID=2805397 RepID=UPI003982DA18